MGAFKGQSVIQSNCWWITQEVLYWGGSGPGEKMLWCRNVLKFFWNWEEKIDIWFQITFHFKEPLLYLSSDIITLKCLSGSFYLCLFVFFIFGAAGIFHTLNSFLFNPWLSLFCTLSGATLRMFKLWFIHKERKQKKWTFSLLLLFVLETWNIQSIVIVNTTQDIWGCQEEHLQKYLNVIYA